MGILEGRLLHRAQYGGVVNSSDKRKRLIFVRASSPHKVNHRRSKEMIPTKLKEAKRHDKSVSALDKPENNAVSKASELVANAHRASVITPVDKIAWELQDLLSRRLTAYIAGVKDGKTVARWATGEIKDIRVDNELQLRTAYECAQLLFSLGSAGIAKAWFIQQSPDLGDVAPAQALNEGRLKDVRLAARAFVGGSGGS